VGLQDVLVVGLHEVVDNDAHYNEVNHQALCQNSSELLADISD
jgi:hypothetical protein